MGVMICEGEGTPPFAEQTFYARLCKLGRALGVTVYVFSPLWADTVRLTVDAYIYEPEAAGWVRRTFPLPDVIYDRSFFTGHPPFRCRTHLAAVRRLMRIKTIPYLGYGLKGKWEVLQFLRRIPELRPYLPKTERIRDFGLIGRRLSEWGSVFLKPEYGTHGKGALFVGSAPDGAGFCVRGRDSGNAPIERNFRDIRSLTVWLKHFAGTRSYLCQQYLTLLTKNGDAYDVRSLMQKNGSGLWELTGMAVRLGRAGSVTSNLHGGGRAAEIQAFLTAEFGFRQAERIEQTLREISERIPPALEASNGRMAELGLDLGVDRDGRVWIIEVNSKPGRSVFHHLCQEAKQRKAARQPVAYAHYLLTRGRLAPKGSRAAACFSPPLTHYKLAVKASNSD